MRDEKMEDARDIEVLICEKDLKKEDIKKRNGIKKILVVIFEIIMKIG